MRHRFQELRDDERGQSLVFVAGGFMAFVAATTLAIDVGLLMTARSQAQNSADAGALAGAVALGFNSFTDRSSSGPAVQSAISAAEANQIIAASPKVLPADVTFPNDPLGRPTRVHVAVQRSAERTPPGPIPTFIAKIFGINTVNIHADATAEASPASAETCVKPFMIPDKWQENSNPAWNAQTSTYDYYDNKGNVLPNHDVYVPIDQPGYTGYTAADRGTLLIIRAGTGNNISPTMYYSWKMPSAIGGDYYRDNISGCNQTVIRMNPKDPYYMTQEPGDMTGPTNQGIDDLIAKDPGATWDTSCNCVKGSQFNISPRITPLPLYNPQYYADGKANGRNASFELANIMGFFIWKRSGNQVYGYITPIGGLLDPNVGVGAAGAFPVAIRLVQ